MGVKGENSINYAVNYASLSQRILKSPAEPFLAVTNALQIPSGISVSILRVLFLSLRVRVVRFVELLELGVLTVLSVRRVELSELLVLVVRFVERFELQVLVFGTLNYVNFADYEFGAFNS